MGNVPEQNNTPTASDIGLSRKDIYEARQIRDAEEAQDRGEVQKHGGQGKRDIPNKNVLTAAEIGLTHKDIHEARQIGGAWDQSSRLENWQALDAAALAIAAFYSLDPQRVWETVDALAETILEARGAALGSYLERPVFWTGLGFYVVDQLTGRTPEDGVPPFIVGTH